MARRSIAERLAQLKARKKGACIVVGEGSTGCPGDKAKGFARRIRASSVRDDRQPASSMRMLDWLRANLPAFLTRQGNGQLFNDILISAATEANDDREERR